MENDRYNLGLFTLYDLFHQKQDTMKITFSQSRKRRQELWEHIQLLGFALMIGGLGIWFMYIILESLP